MLSERFIWEPDDLVIVMPKKAFDPSEPRDEQGQWTDGGDSGGDGDGGDAGYEFVSPNVGNLNFDGAVKELGGERQGVLHDASEAINRELGMDAESHDVVGAWSDGAENSVMDVVGHSDWDKLVLAGAMKGWIADQKSVLVFQQRDQGDGALAQFEAQGNLKEIHENLLADGLANHTLVPTAKGATVFVADLDNTQTAAVKKAASRYGADNKIQVHFGHGEFIGTDSNEGSDRDQRDSARSVYETHIDRSPVSGSKEIWERVRDRWGKALAESDTAKSARRIYVRSSLVEAHRLISQIEAAGDVEIIPYDGEHIPGTELIDLHEWDQRFNPYHEPGGSPEGGEFAEGGGTGEGGASADSLNDGQTTDHNVEHLIDKVSGARTKVDDAREKLSKSVATDKLVSEGGYKLPGGGWTPEREKLHDKIISQIITPEAFANAIPAAGEKPTLHFLGGRGGAGKSWFTKEGKKVDLEKNFLINNDEIKKMLPEYQGWNAADLHEEASEIGDRIEKIAKDQKLNIVLDGTMRSPKNVQRRVDAYHKDGYRIEGHYMYASPAVAAQRALQRFVDGGKDGRFVPPEYTLNSTTNEKSFDSVRGSMDKWEVYDNNAPDFNPVLHAEGGKQDSGAPLPRFSPGVKANTTFADAKDVKRGWVAVSPIKTMDDAQKVAQSSQDMLAQAGDEIAAKLGVVFKDPGNKIKNASGIARVEKKAADRGGHVAAVTDIARATFVIEHPEESDAIINELGKHFEVAAEPWKLTDVNYGDRAANVRLPSGLIGEIQIMDKYMNQAKSPSGGGGHDLYKIQRDAAPEGVKPNPALYASTTEKQQKLYGKVLENYPAEWKAVFGNG